MKKKSRKGIKEKILIEQYTNFTFCTHFCTKIFSLRNAVHFTLPESSNIASIMENIPSSQIKKNKLFYSLIMLVYDSCRSLIQQFFCFRMRYTQKRTIVSVINSSSANSAGSVLPFFSSSI